MHRLLLGLAMSFLFAACAAPSPVVTPTPVSIPELTVEAPVDLSAEIPAMEPSADALPTDESPQEVATPPPPVANTPVDVPRAEARTNPSGIPLARNPSAQVNPSGPPPVVGGALSAETRAVAVPFLQTVLRRDLAAAREYFAPGVRPESWSNVIPAEALTGMTSDFSECMGTEPSTSDLPESATLHSITFRFPNDCARVPVQASATPDQVLQRFNGLGVRLAKVDNRWWVTGIGAFRAAS